MNEGLFSVARRIMSPPNCLGRFCHIDLVGYQQ